MQVGNLLDSVHQSEKKIKTKSDASQQYKSADIWNIFEIFQTATQKFSITEFMFC